MKRIIYLLFSVLLFAQCSTIAPLLEQKTSVEKTVINRDSITKTIINNAINDRLTVPVIASKTNDANFDFLVNSKIDEILSKLNTSKSSGDNGYNFYYDLLNRQLQLETKIGQTKSEQNKTTKDTDQTKSELNIKPVIVNKPYNLAEKMIFSLGLFAFVYFGFRLFLFIKSKSPLFV